MKNEKIPKVTSSGTNMLTSTQFSPRVVLADARRSSFEGVRPEIFDLVQCSRVLRLDPTMIHGQLLYYALSALFYTQC